MQVPVTREPWFDNGRRYGYGWRPIRWQGWATMGVFIILFLAVTQITRNIVAIVVMTLGLIMLLVLVAYLTGGKPGMTGWDDETDAGPSGE